MEEIALDYTKGVVLSLSSCFEFIIVVDSFAAASFYFKSSIFFVFEFLLSP